LTLQALMYRWRRRLIYCGNLDQSQ
jgi:hypothetical protein